MKVWLAFCQPDHDWDHHATILGIYSTPEKAEARRMAYDPGEFHVLECEIDENLPLK